MKLVKYNTLPTINRMDRIFEGASTLSRRMPIEVHETEDDYIILAEVPGFTNEEISIEVARDGLTIEAAKNKVETTEDIEEIEDTIETSEETSKIIYSEFSNHKYLRKLNFKKEIDSSGASSILENGILTVTVPKAEIEKPVKITPKIAN